MFECGNVVGVLSHRSVTVMGVLREGCGCVVGVLSQRSVTVMGVLRKGCGCVE